MMEDQVKPLVHAQTQRSDCRLLLDEGKLESENSFQLLIDGFKKDSNLRFSVQNKEEDDKAFSSMIKRAKTSFMDSDKKKS
jgi:hypothetical protein